MGRLHDMLASMDDNEKVQHVIDGKIGVYTVKELKELTGFPKESDPVTPPDVAAAQAARKAKKKKK